MYFQGDSDVDHVTSSTSSKKQQGTADHENIVQLVQVRPYEDHLHINIHRITHYFRIDKMEPCIYMHCSFVEIF